MFFVFTELTASCLPLFFVFVCAFMGEEHGQLVFFGFDLILSYPFVCLFFIVVEHGLDTENGR